MKLKIYLLTQRENTGYDTYDAMVVVAEDKKEARRMHPDQDKDWFPSNFDYWGSVETGTNWATKLKNVRVKEIGEASPKMKKGIVLSSFNAG